VVGVPGFGCVGCSWFGGLVVPGETGALAGWATAMEADELSSTVNIGPRASLPLQLRIE